METVKLMLWSYRPLKSGKCPIKLTYNRNGRYFKWNTGFACYPPQWDKENEEILGAVRENEKLSKLKSDLQQLIVNYRLEHHENPSIEWVKENWQQQNDKENYFTEYIESFIEAKRPIVTREAIRDYVSFRNAFKEFQTKENKRFKPDSFTKATLERFHSFCLKTRGLNNNTCHNRMRTFKSILNYYSFNVPNYKVKTYNPENTTLNDHELNLIKDYQPQTGRHQRVKDLFLIGCSVGLRFGDLRRLQPNHFVEENGKTYIQLFTSKTKDSIKLPLNSLALEIVKKYDFQPPKISNQKFNKFIKELLKQIPIFRETFESKTKIRGNKQETVQKPKYELIGSHSMRRTFITRALEKGLPPAAVAKYTGLTIATMYSYVNKNQNSEEHEQKLEI
jgi:integrase